MLEKYYPIHSVDELEEFLLSYMPLIRNQLSIFDISLSKFGISIDHLGLQVISKLKPGFEHIAMKVDRFDDLQTYFIENNLPIDKLVEYGGARFFKTKFVNLVEIEFRDGYLWQDLLREKTL